MKSNADLAPEVSDDPKAAAKARKRRRARSRVVRLLGAGVVGSVLLGLTALLKISHADYSAVRDQVASQEAQLRTLQAQQRSNHHRLSALQHEKGRAQSLIEHGYVRPGDRILLFPATPPSTALQATQDDKTQNGQAQSNAASEAGNMADTARDNKLAAAASGQAPAASAASGVASRDAMPPATALRPALKPSPQLQPQSAWRRAGQTLQGWWQALRGAGAAPQDQN